MMRKKLGLVDHLPDDTRLIDDLLSWMSDNHRDFTNTFRDLSQTEKPTHENYQHDSFQKWYQRWKKRQLISQKPLKDIIDLMQRNNPRIIPRNHRIAAALNAAYENDLRPFTELHHAMKTPYSYYDGIDPFSIPPTPSERIYQTFCGT